MGDGRLDLPPGFEFRPTDEDLVLHFLNHKVLDSPSFPNIIPDLDCHLHNPWELNGKAMSDGKQWYFFSRMKKKEETRDGFWKEQEVEEEAVLTRDNEIGMKKYFVFCVGQPLQATETNWVMIEYSLCMITSSSFHTARNTKLDYGKWVLCRVYEKGEFDRNDDSDDKGSELSYLDEMFLSLDDHDLDEICSN